MSQNNERDSLGNRMKHQYEDRTRYYVPRRTFAIIRLDGKAFHTYTKNCKKPFDSELSEDIDNAVIAILPQIQGAKFAYTQSDEISILVTDFDSIDTTAWFDGNIQKIASVSASLLTAEFNKNRYERMARGVFDRAFRHISDGNQIVYSRYAENVHAAFETTATATFDARLFTIPDRVEVMNYFRWRSQDWMRNSVAMVAQANFSQKELDGKSISEVKSMLIEKAYINWDAFSGKEKYGRIIRHKDIHTAACEKYHAALTRVFNTLFDGGVLPDENPEPAPRCTHSEWCSCPAWDFTNDNMDLLELIPQVV